MPETVNHCPLCSSSRSRLFDKRRFHGIEVINRVCLNCGLVYQSPRMTEKESTAFYAEEYRILQEGSVDPTAHNVAVQKERAISLVEFIRPMVPAVSRHLDIGCSLGILLQHIKAQYNSQSVGVEPGENHRILASGKGFMVYPSIEELEKAGEKCFELISLSHVLEHLHDPVGYLVLLRESFLTPDGRLLLEVPNLFTHNSFEVAHLCAFSSHTLQEVLHRAGFEIVKFEKHGRPNSAILPLFLTALCRPASQLDLVEVRPERWVAIKRQIGMLKRHILERLMPTQAWLKIQEEAGCPR
jgi:SAM-dependent methyltransferase